jgi:hypothetical protein
MIAEATPSILAVSAKLRNSKPKRWASPRRRIAPSYESLKMASTTISCIGSTDILASGLIIRPENILSASGRDLLLK